MGEAITQAILDELQKIPNDQLPTVLTLLRGLQPLESGTSAGIMSLAGSWQDMPATEFDDFLGEISANRQAAFAARPAL